MTSKIVYVIGQLGFGGAERQLLELVKGLDRRKYDPVVVCLSAGGGMQGRFEQVCQVIVLKQLMRIDVSRLLRLIRVLRKIKPIIVHGYLSTGVLWGTLAAKCAGVPFVVGGWRLADPADAIRDRVINRVVGAVNNLMISNTALMKTFLVERDGVNSEKIQVIPNGVSLDRFELLPAKDSVRSKLGIRSDSVVIGNVARFFPQKDHSTLLMAMRDLLDDTENIECVLAGDGSMRLEMEALSRDLGIDKHVHFLGTCENVPEVVSAIDIFVLSSRWEGMPNVILEAMACGKPVVATDVGGSPEVVVNGETGLLVPPGDPHKLADAIKRLVLDEEMRVRMGVSGRERIENLFTVERMVETTERSYNLLINQNSRE